MAIECVPLSATDGSAKILDNMTLVELRMAIFYAVKSAFVRKRLEKSAYHALLLHSMAGRARNDLNNVSRLVRKAGDENILVQPYLMSAPGLQQKKMKIMSRDPSGGMWKNLSIKRQSETRIIQDNEYKVPACAAHFDMDAELPTKWRDAFTDYNLFVKNVVLAMKDPLINIFAGNEGFIDKVLKSLRNKKMTVVLGDSDKQENQVINMALFGELKRLRPDIYNVHLINGGDHYFENTPAEYAAVMDRIIFGMKDKTRG
jgi:hypothetical protein